MVTLDSAIDTISWATTFILSCYLLDFDSWIRNWLAILLEMHLTLVQGKQECSTNEMVMHIKNSSRNKHDYYLIFEIEIE